MSEPRVHRPSGFGDLIRAIVELKASDQEALAIAAMLGLLPAGVVQLPIAEPPPLTGTEVERGAVPLEVFEVGPVEPMVQPTPQSDISAASGPVVRQGEHELALVGADAPPARSWISDAEALEPPATGPVPYDATIPPFEPLLSPVIARAVLVEAAATRAHDGPIDIDRLVHDMATRRPVHTLPRSLALTLRRGAQILVDRTASMQPFQADADDLAARIKQVTSQGATQLLYFDEDPTIVDDTWPVSEGRPHEPPSSGTPIVVITDLGIRNLRSGRSRARRYWLTFALEALRHRCPIIAFVPYPSPRWPAGLKGLVTPVLWDRKTTVAGVRAAWRSEGR